MTEHLITDEIKSYLKREMPPAELLKADDHLAECEACFQIVKDLSGEQTADFDFQPDFSEETRHLSYEQLENYADEKADDAEREITEVHLRVCDHCRAEFNGLLEMRELIEADLQKQVLTEKPTTSWLENIFSRGYFLKTGFAAVALAIFALAVFWISKRDATAPEIAANQSPSNVSTPIVSTPTPANAAPNTEINAPPNVNTNLQNQLPEEKKNKLPPAYQAEIERVLAANRLSFPAELNQLKGQTGKLMSGGSESVPFALESPLGKIIQTDRPQFRWRALEGADGYVVNVYDTNFNRVAGSGQIKATVWQADRPLAGNKIYIWQVTALKDGQEIKSPVRPAPDARFKVIDGGKLNEIARLSREYKNEHLALGILYANAGLLEEAAREFQKELAGNPNSKQARGFLQQVRARR